MYTGAFLGERGGGQGNLAALYVWPESTLSDHPDSLHCAFLCLLEVLMGDNVRLFAFEFIV